MTETTPEERPPTLAEVKQQEAKAEELEAKAAELENRERQLSEKLAEAHADGASEETIAALMAERREVVALRGDMEAALPLIAERTAKMREVACGEEARKRLVAIARAHGSLRSELEADLKRLAKAADEFAGRVEKLNERHGRLALLEAEAGALAHRFGLEAPELPRVPPPARTVAAVEGRRVATGAHLADWTRIRVAEETDEFGHSRRTYEELAEDTPGREIIQEAGLRPFPEPSEEHRTRVERRKAQQLEQERRMREVVESYELPPVPGHY